MRTRKKIPFYLSLFLLLATVLVCGGSTLLYASRFGDLEGRPAMQLSRVDFQEPVDTTQAQKIKRFLKSLDGVGHVYFNHKDDIVVYGHHPAVRTSQETFREMQLRFPIEMQRYVVSPEMASGGCPVTGSRSVFMQIGGFVYKIFQ